MNVGVDYSHARISNNGVTSAIGGGGESTAPAGSDGSAAVPGTLLEEFDLYQAGFDATWELDLFGRVRRGVEAANAQVQASVEGRRGVLLSLLGEVARNYVELRGGQRQLALAKDNLGVQQQSLDLVRQRLAQGLTNQLDVARAEAQVATTAAQLPALQLRVSQTVHRLGTLLGRQPPALSAELGEPEPIPPVPDLVPVGLPADLLRRRPDVRQAERQLAAATATVGVATADLFPRVTINGSIGLQSIEPGNLFEYASRYYSIGPSISLPIFDGGRRRAQVRVQQARRDQAFYQYQQTVLDSLREVEDALVGYDKEQERRNSLEAAVAANQQAVRLARELYGQGVTDFLTVLDAQRELFASQGRAGPQRHAGVGDARLALQGPRRRMGTRRRGLHQRRRDDRDGSGLQFDGHPVRLGVAMSQGHPI